MSIRLSDHKLNRFVAVKGPETGVSGRHHVYKEIQK